MIIVNIPVSRFMVEFEVASGRPYSVLERLMLKAVNEGATSIAGLEDVFRVPRRLLIEGLVTLTQAGWLALSEGRGEVGFLLTREGQDALQTGREPRSSLVVDTRPPAYVVMESLTGALILNSDVFLHPLSRRDLDPTDSSRDHIRWDKALTMKPRVFGNRLDQSQVQHLLLRGRGEWIRSIGPIQLESRGKYVAPVAVDPEARTITGLPDQWRARLQSLILEEVSDNWRLLDEDSRSQPWNRPASRPDDPEAAKAPPVSWPVTLRREDLLLTESEHTAFLNRVFSEAESSMIVASAFLSLQALDDIEGTLVGALGRGVSIDFLWGYDEDPGAVQRLRTIARQTRDQGAKGILRFNQEKSGSHAKLLIWKDGEGYAGCVGSYNWLSRGAAKRKGHEGVASNVSVVVRHPVLLSRLSRTVAAFWTAAQADRLSSASDKWDQIASDLEEEATRLSQNTEDTISPTRMEVPNAEVFTVLDGDHEFLLGEWVSQAQTRLLVTSHKLGPPSLRRLRFSDGEFNPGPFAYYVAFGETDLSGDAIDDVKELVEKNGGKLAHISGLHAKVVVSDDSACISSYNFLYGAPFGPRDNAREVGLAIRGAEPADWLWEHLTHAIDSTGSRHP